MRYYSEKKINFTDDYINYNQFLLQQFFNCNIETWKQICKYYRKEYGNRSLSYLSRKFDEWKNGDYHLTDLMESRILETMPKFLTPNAKEQLSLNDFSSSIKKSIKLFEKKQKSRSYKFDNLSDIELILEVFEKEINIINNLTLEKTRFGFLSLDEKIEAENIVKYILKLKLQTVYDQLRNDLNIILPFLGKVTRGKFLIQYLLNELNFSFTLKNIRLINIEFPAFKINNIQSKSRFKVYANKYLAYEMLAIHDKAISRKPDGLINHIDLNTFFNQYEKFIDNDNEVKMNSLFRGEAGRLIINAHVIPIKLLNLSIVKSIYKILFITIIVILVIAFFIVYDAWIMIFPLYFIVIPALIYAYVNIRRELKNIIQYKNELKYHGKSTI